MIPHLVGFNEKTPPLCASAVRSQNSSRSSLNGRLSVESQSGQGAMFRVELPVTALLQPPPPHDTCLIVDPLAP